MKLLIPTASAVEAVVKRELFRLGFGETRATNGRIEIEGGFDAVARCNVFLRSGERVLWVLKEFSALTFDEVYDNVYALDWKSLMPQNARILTYAKAVNSQLFAIKSLCSVVKKAIVDKLIASYGNNLDESGARFMVELSLFENNATLSLDTTGESLHKRGYRTLAYTAPLKETLAAAMIDLSFFHPDKEFADVFCGSGTLPIEAALIAKSIAPGKNRDFDFKRFPFVEESFYKQAIEEALDKEKRDKKISVCGYDVDKNAISISKYHAKNAGVDKDVHFEVADMRDFTAKNPYGVLISNPPYGERLNDKEEVKTLYADLGKMCKRLPKWNCYFLTNFEGFERAYGRRADKKRKLYNGNLECCFYTFSSPKPKD